MLASTLLVLSFIPVSAFTQEKPTIRWLTWEQSPNFITKGEYAGQGLGDSFTKALQLKLPQYQHENIISNTRRYNLLIREENVCVAWAWIIPGSKEYRVHSRAVSLAPPTGILTLKAKQDLFGKPGEILSLESLLLKSDLTLGYLEDMSYSKKVNDLLEQNRGKENVHFSSRGEVEFHLSMLDRERLDYFFAFSAQAIFDAEIRGIPNKYQFYNIEEIPMYSSLHSHCSKTSFGKEVMAEIDKVITNEMLMDQLSNVERWYGKNAKYREVFKDYVINQNPNKFVAHPGE